MKEIGEEVADALVEVLRKYDLLNNDAPVLRLSVHPNALYIGGRGDNIVATSISGEWGNLTKLTHVERDNDEKTN